MKMSFISENWLNVLLVIVGLSAFGVYFAQKRDQRKSAATLLKSQIDAIEKSVAILRNDHDLGNISVYQLNVLINENMWEKYRHLFVKRMTRSETDTIQEFYDNAERIERARKDIVQTVYNAWEHKSLIEHIHSGLYVNDAVGSNPAQALEKIAGFRTTFDPLETAFTPQVLIQTLTNNMLFFRNLSGSTAYQKLEKWSYDK